MDQALMEELLSGLNPEQRTAASHGADPLLIVAGAGTGKTTTLAHRVAYLIATGFDPSRILLLTFTRRASAEMLRRVDGILRRLQEVPGSTFPARVRSRQVWGGTFHATAARLLRKYGRYIGVIRDFTIFDQGDAQDLMRVAQTELGIGEKDAKFPAKGVCLAIYSRCVNTQRPLSEILADDYPWCAEHEADLRKLFDGYMDRKERNGVLDYDDLLLFWQAMMQQPECGEAIRRQFDAVLVDEYQDTNLLQAEILRLLKPGGQGLTVVGDDAQSIYAFRGATVRNILDFPQDFPSATMVTLEQNYRSTPSILEATNQIIAEAKEGHRKRLWSEKEDLEAPQLVECQDEDEETEFIVDEVLEARETGMKLREQAILFRSSHHCMMLEAELTRRSIPFQKFGGLKFMETAHVKDVLAFLRLAENPRDVVSGQRILTLLPGIGQKTANRLITMLAGGPDPFAAWADYTPPAKSREIWPELLKMLNDLSAPDESRSISEEVRRTVAFYKPILDRKFDESNARMLDLQQLEQVASRFPDRGTFLAEITLDPPTSTRDLSGENQPDEDYLVLSTIHSAKGLEWDTVFLMQACDGSIPSRKALGSEDDLEEERRLFYVALTRAKHRLYVMHPARVYFQSRFRGDNYGYSPISRFLSRDTRKHFSTSYPSDLEGDGGLDAVHEETTTAEIRDRFRRNF